MKPEILDGLVDVDMAFVVFFVVTGGGPMMKNDSTTDWKSNGAQFRELLQVVKVVANGFDAMKAFRSMRYTPYPSSKGTV